MAINLRTEDLENDKFVESTVTSGQPGIAIVNPDGSNVGASVELSEFPAAAALADNTANPTTTGVAAYGMVYDGATWDRMPGDSTNGTKVQPAVGGAGAVTAVTPRVTHASDDPVTTALQLIDDTVFTDDATFTPGTSKGLMMMAQADETGPDSVDEGDAGALRMTLTRYLKVTLGELISGEDQTNNVLQVVEKPLGVTTYCPDLDTSAAAEASSVTKASGGVLYGVTFSNANAATRYFQLFNSTTVPADTTVPVITFACTTGGTIALEWAKGRAFSTGIAWCNSTTQNTKTVGSADSIADINYK